jgi:hypothetical protein
MFLSTASKRQPLKFLGRKSRNSKSIWRKVRGLDWRGEEMQRRSFEE